MSAENPFHPPHVETRASHESLSRETLQEVATAFREAAVRSDLDEVIDAHVSATGKLNPNAAGEGFFVGLGELPMSGESDYRNVDERAIADLIDTGVVRGAFTATEGKRSNTEGHTVYWFRGEEGRKMCFTSPGHFIIEAPKAVVEAGWVKASDVRAIHAKDADGHLVDLTKL